MLTLDHGKYPVVRTAPAHQLEELTRAGWRVLAVVETRTPVSLPLQSGGYSYDAAGRVLSPPTPHEVREARDPLFVLGLDEESVVAQATADMNAAKTARQAAEKQRDEAREREKVAKQDAERCRSYYEELNKQIASGKERIQALNDAKAALEADIAKIRTAIGARQMREILGENGEAKS